MNLTVQITSTVLSAIMAWCISAGIVFTLVFVAFRSVVIQKVIISFDTFFAVFDRLKNIFSWGKRLNTYKIDAPRVKQNRYEVCGFEFCYVSYIPYRIIFNCVL
jgi:hypothetical protein